MAVMHPEQTQEASQFRGNCSTKPILYGPFLPTELKYYPASLALAVKHALINLAVRNLNPILPELYYLWFPMKLYNSDFGDFHIATGRMISFILWFYPLQHINCQRVNMHHLQNEWGESDVIVPFCHLGICLGLLRLVCLSSSHSHLKISK